MPCAKSNLSSRWFIVSGAWLTETLAAIANGHKQSNISNLIPWNYAKHVSHTPLTGR